MAAVVESYNVPFLILVDSAEGQPWTFDGLESDAKEGYRPLAVKWRFQALGRFPHSYGDYSIEGFTGRVGVERKSLEDVQATVLGWESPSERTHNLPGRRDRFEKELDNLSKLEAGCVVVEATLDDVLRAMPSYGKKSIAENRKSFFRSYVAYGQDFKVNWHWMSGRRMAEVFTFRYLARFYRKFGNVK